MLPIRSNVGFRTAGVQTNVGFRGLAGALDLDAVTLATGAPGTQVTFSNGVLTIPQGPVGPASTVPGPKGDPGEPGPAGPASTVPGPAGTSASVRTATAATAAALSAQYPSDLIVVPQ